MTLTAVPLTITVLLENATVELCVVGQTVRAAAELPTNFRLVVFDGKTDCGAKLVVGVTLKEESVRSLATKLVHAPRVLKATVPDPNLSVNVAVLEPATHRLAIAPDFVCDECIAPLP
jgi:hypothetical protein